jgi:Glycosyl transferase family 2
MRLVSTLVVRDEVDVVDSQLSYHLAAGVDFVLATDHDSRDGTAEILASYEGRGVLRLFREHGAMEESRWRTRMARLASAEHDADWVLNTDADEFWFPCGGTLKEVLVAIPERFGVVWGLTRHFVPRPDDGAPFAERMTTRVAQQAALNDPTGPYRPHAKVAHRADDEIVVRFGSHEVVSELAPLRGWHPADVLHFPFRSLEQYERKNVRRARGDKPLGQYVKGLQASEAGRLEEAYRSLTVPDHVLARGLAEGSLVQDTRLRNALRALSSGAPLEAAPHQPGPPVDAAALRDADLVRLARRVDGLVARVEQLGPVVAAGVATE